MLSWSSHSSLLNAPFLNLFPQTNYTSFFALIKIFISDFDLEKFSLNNFFNIIVWLKCPWRLNSIGDSFWQIDHCFWLKNSFNKTLQDFAQHKTSPQPFESQEIAWQFYNRQKQHTHVGNMNTHSYNEYFGKCPSTQIM